jgi:iron complex outermembrane recepter protein
VLPVGSSAIYGADSLAGAVNIILRKDLDGFEASVRYGGAAGTNETDTSSSWGTKWDQGSASIIGSYQHKNPLSAADRAVTAHPRFSTLAVYGQGDACNPGTVYSSDGGNLPGLSSSQAAIPHSISGKPSLADFAATAGKVNTCGALGNDDLIPDLNRVGLMASAHQAINNSLDVFTELVLSHEAVNSQVGDEISLYNAFGDTLPASNAYNPFGEDVGISWSYAGQGYYYRRYTDFIRPLIGVRGVISGDWNYEVSAFVSYDRSHVEQSDTNPDAITAALASSDPATALNPFASGAPGSPRLLASLMAPSILRFDSKSTTVEALVRGTLVHLPAGPLAVVLGAEYDHNSIFTHEQNTDVSSPPFSAGRSAYSLFTEARVPLLAAGLAHPAPEKLALSLAGRYDAPDDYEHKATGQIGLEWRPWQTLLLRGGYSTSYQAPQLTELYGATSSFLENGLVDPYRGNAPVNNVPLAQGPNPGLKPETGQSSSLGVVYTGGLPGLQLSLTYWAIRIRNFINTPNDQDLIDYPQLFPQAVTRGPPSAQDIQNGYPGPITAINGSYVNFGDLDVRGLDMDASLAPATSVGEFTPQLSATETLRYDSALVPGAPALSYVSQAATTGFAPRWKGTVALGWKLDPLIARVDGRYIGPYNDYPGMPFTYPHDIGNFWIFDANVRYAIGSQLGRDKRFLAGTYIELGAVNLFNNLPKNSYYFYPFDAQEADIRGRFLYVQLGVKL